MKKTFNFSIELQACINAFNSFMIFMWCFIFSSFLMSLFFLLLHNTCKMYDLCGKSPHFHKKIKHLCTWELQYTNKKCILCNSKCLSTICFFILRNFKRYFTSLYSVLIFLCLHVCNMCLHIQVNYCLCNLPARIHIYFI